MTRYHMTLSCTRVWLLVRIGVTLKRRLRGGVVALARLVPVHRLFEQLECCVRIKEARW